MKKERLKNLTKRIVRKTIIFTIVMVVISAIAQSMGTIVTNELALTQMQNSNEMYMLMSVYDKVKHIVNLAYPIAVGCFVGTVGRDICYVMETIKNEKEN